MRGVYPTAYQSAMRWPKGCLAGLGPTHLLDDPSTAGPRWCWRWAARIRSAPSRLLGSRSVAANRDGWLVELVPRSAETCPRWTRPQPPRRRRGSVPRGARGECLPPGPNRGKRPQSPVTLTRWVVRGAAASSSGASASATARPSAYRSRASPPDCITTMISPASGSPNTKEARIASIAIRSAANWPDAIPRASARQPGHQQ